MKIPRGYGSFHMYSLFWRSPMTKVIRILNSAAAERSALRPGSPLEGCVGRLEEFTGVRVEDEESFLRLVQKGRQAAKEAKELGVAVNLPDPEGWSEEDERKLLAMEVLGT